MPRSFFKYDPVKIDFPNEAPVWMIFDQQLKDSQLIITMIPGDPTPEWVDQANSIRDLQLNFHYKYIWYTNSFLK